MDHVTLAAERRPHARIYDESTFVHRKLGCMESHLDTPTGRRMGVDRLVFGHCGGRGKQRRSLGCGVSGPGRGE